MTKKQKKILIRIIITVILTIALFFVPVTGVLRLLIYLAVYAVIGYDIVLKAAKGIVNGRVFDENFLMTIATLGAFFLGFWTGSGDYTEAVAVMLFYQVGELFEGYAVGKSRRNISELMDIRPDYANIEVDGVLTRVDPEEVAVGTVITVQPGEKIPIDGIVTRGTSTIDTAALTGESLPRVISEGDEIYSGTINMDHVLKICTTKEFGESTASRILDLVENASSNKSRTENFISRFAAVYTPIVCCAALFIAAVIPLIRIVIGLGGEWETWVYRGLTFLVVSCPCAFVISIPLSFFAGLGCAGNEGILVKGSDYLEALSRVTTVVFDKTGTLTRGNFEVNHVCSKEITVQGNLIDAKRLIEYAALSECASSHPISRSLKQAYLEQQEAVSCQSHPEQQEAVSCQAYAEKPGCSNGDICDPKTGASKEPDRNRVSDIHEISGYGVTAVVDGVTVANGNGRLMDMLGIDYEPSDEAGTINYVALDNEYAGYIVISDEVKPTSAGAIEELRKNGLEQAIMLTGDVEKVACKVGKELGMDEIHAGLLPAQKVEIVEEILDTMKELPVSSKCKLAFVGDGINDAPVLARADVGIAMGALGTDAAIEAADVVLMDDDPMQIVKAVRISRRCIRIVYENIVFALLIKVGCLVLTTCGITNMWAAIFADTGVMVICVINAVRALKYK